MKNRRVCFEVWCAILQVCVCVCGVLLKLRSFRGTSEQLSFNSVSLFLDTTGLKFMSLLVPRFKFLMRLSKEILKLNRIRQRYISNIDFLNFTANQTPSMVNWWGLLAILGFNIDSTSIQWIFSHQNVMTFNKALQLHWSRCFWWSLGNFHVEVLGGVRNPRWFQGNRFFFESD